MSAFPARWPGVCGACGERFEADTLVRYEDGQVVEVTCTPPPVEPGRESMCPDCFMIHGKGQRGCQ